MQLCKLYVFCLPIYHARQQRDIGIEVKELSATLPLASKYLIIENLVWYVRHIHLIPLLAPT